MLYKYSIRPAVLATACKPLLLQGRIEVQALANKLRYIEARQKEMSSRKFTNPRHLSDDACIIFVGLWWVGG